MVKTKVQDAVTRYINENQVPSNCHFKPVFDEYKNPKGEIKIEFNSHGKFGYSFLNPMKVSSFESLTKVDMDASKKLLEIIKGSGELYYGRAFVSGTTHVSGTRSLKAYSVKYPVDGAGGINFKLADDSSVISFSKERNPEGMPCLYYYPNDSEDDVRIAALIIGNEKKIVDPTVLSINEKNVLSVKYDLSLQGCPSRDEALKALGNKFPGNEITINEFEPDLNDMYRVDLTYSHVQNIIDGGIDPTDITSMNVALGTRAGDIAIKLERNVSAGRCTGYDLSISAFGNFKSDVLDLISKEFGWKAENGSDLNISSTIKELYDVEKSR